MSSLAWFAVTTIAVAFALLVWEIIAWLDQLADRRWERQHLSRYHEQTRRRR